MFCTCYFLNVISHPDLWHRHSSSPVCKTFTIIEVCSRKQKCSPASVQIGTSSYRKWAVHDISTVIRGNCVLWKHRVSFACTGYLRGICVCDLPRLVLLQHMLLPWVTVVLTAAYLLSRTMCRGENSILGQLKTEGKSFIFLLYVFQSWDAAVQCLCLWHTNQILQLLINMACCDWGISQHHVLWAHGAGEWPPPLLLSHGKVFRNMRAVASCQTSCLDAALIRRRGGPQGEDSRGCSCSGSCCLKNVLGAHFWDWQAFSLSCESHPAFVFGSCQTRRGKGCLSRMPFLSCFLAMRVPAWNQSTMKTYLSQISGLYIVPHSFWVFA